MYSRFILSFAASICLCVAALVVLIQVGGDRIPAPQLSTSESFNEKARWLRGTLQLGRCDILIVGSSISLNNLDGKLLGERTGKTVLNLASWGLTPDEAMMLSASVSQLCRPQIVLMATYHGDFMAQDAGDKSIVWKDVAEYIRGRGRLIAYLHSFDLSEFVLQMMHQKYKHTTGVYQSLQFDSTGSVGLDCENFHRLPVRWNGYKTALPPVAVQKSIQKVADLARQTLLGGARFVLAVPPLRHVADEEYYPHARDELWGEVGREIERAGGTFIRSVNSDNSFTDEEFADYAHLNACGAKHWTDLIWKQTLQ